MVLISRYSFWITEHRTQFQQWRLGYLMHLELDRRNINFMTRAHKLLLVTAAHNTAMSLAIHTRLTTQLIQKFGLGPCKIDD